MVPSQYDLEFSLLFHDASPELQDSISSDGVCRSLTGVPAFLTLTSADTAKGLQVSLPKWRKSPS